VSKSKVACSLSFSANAKILINDKHKNLWPKLQNASAMLIYIAIGVGDPKRLGARYFWLKKSGLTKRAL